MPPTFCWDLYFWPWSPGSLVQRRFLEFLLQIMLTGDAKNWTRDLLLYGSSFLWAMPAVQKRALYGYMKLPSTRPPISPSSSKLIAGTQAKKGLSHYLLTEGSYLMFRAPFMELTVSIRVLRSFNQRCWDSEILLYLNVKCLSLTEAPQVTNLAYAGCGLAACLPIGRGGDILLMFGCKCHSAWEFEMHSHPCSFSLHSTRNYFSCK